MFTFLSITSIKQKRITLNLSQSDLYARLCIESTCCHNILILVFWCCGTHFLMQINSSLYLVLLHVLRNLFLLKMCEFPQLDWTIHAD